MDITDTSESTNLKDILQFLYKIYHFVAKVFLYSILMILILAAILFTLYFIDMARNIKSGNPKSPLFSAYIIISPSMVPTIKVEDAIVIMRKEPEELKKGDIITFLSSDPRYSGLTITHRIVGVEQSESGSFFYRTKGDNNNSEDSALVSSDNVFGKVILKIPKIGYIQYVLTQAYGWVLLVVVPCLGIVIFDILKLIKSIRKSFVPKRSKKQEPSKKEVLEIIGTPNSSSVQGSSEDDIEIL